MYFANKIQEVGNSLDYMWRFGMENIVHLLIHKYLLSEPPDWTEWKEWGECTVTCGGGSQKRIRKCEDHICPDYTECPGPNSQTQVCGEDCCPRKETCF